MANDICPGFLLAPLLLLCGQYAAAQQFLTQESPTLYTNRVCEPADLDGDGDVDLITISFTETRVQWNDGQNRFLASTLMAPNWLSNRGTLGDFDGDGDLDYLTFGPAPTGGLLTVVMVTNQGGTFQTATLAITGLSSSFLWAAMALDFDGDLDLDALLYGNGQVLLLANVGAGQFVDVSAQWLPAIPPATTGSGGRVFDIDTDGRPDVLLWGYDALLLRNTGTRFVVETGRLPLTARRLYEAQVADVDGDGDQDLMVASLVANRLVLVENIGGRLVDASRTQLSPLLLGSSFIWLHALFDADGDGDADLYAYGARPMVFFNDGAGNFRQGIAAPLLAGGIGIVRIAAVDLEGDGDFDLAIFDQGIGLLRNAGGGRLVDPARREEWTLDAWTLMAADVDADGDLDLLGGTGLGRNDGAGGFVMESLTQGIGDQARTRFGDLDADGDVDIVGQRVLLNNGTGSFTLIAGPMWNASEVRRVTVADCDSDGDLDIVSLEGQASSGVVQLHRNRGDATFEPPVSLITGIYFLGLDSADFDGDGDSDLLVSYPLLPFGASSSRLLLQQPNGTFTTQSLPFTRAARFARFAPLPTLDLLVEGPPALQVYRLQAGTFVDVTASVFPSGFIVSMYAIGDVDGDGDNDFVGSQLLRNDGTGRLVPEPGPVSYYGHALADLDGDRDLDLLGSGRVYWNREHHVFVPLPPHVGRNLRVELTSRPGRATSFETAMLGVAHQRLPAGIPGPLGVLHLGALASMLPVAIPSGAGMAPLDLPIPNAPALVGVSMYFQALHISASGLALSNCAGTRIE